MLDFNISDCIVLPCATDNNALNQYKEQSRC